MARSDGTVYIDTKIDTSGIDKGMSATKGKLNTVMGSLNKLGNTIKKTFSGSELSKGMGVNVNNYESQIKKLELQLDKLIEKQIRFIETGGNIKSRAFAGMEYDIAQVSAKLEELRAKKSAVDSISASEQGAVENTSMFKNMVDLLRSSFANLLPNLKIAAKNILSFAGRTVISGIKKLGSQVKKLASSLLSVGKGAKKTNRSLLTMLASSLLFSTVFRAISSLINSFKEGIKNLVQYSDEANASMSALKTASSQLKNSLATAFMPLITIVTPALVGFINTINRALTTIGAFFSALQGKSTFTKAVTVQQNYAEGLKNTSKNAKEAKKSLNQYLTGLDEIKTFTAKQNDSEDKENIGISPSDMFTEQAIPPEISAFADKLKEIFNRLKEYFKNQDWEGLGKYLANGVNIALQKMYDVLNWENVKRKVMPFIIGFTNTFNSLVDNVDWDLMGRTVGTGINTIINIIYEFVSRIDWRKLGQKFGEAINGLVKEIDWAKAGKTLGESIKGLLDLIIGFIEETDWQEVGNSVADFIGGIDWSGITSRLSEGIGAALGGLAAFLWGLIEDAWESVVEWWEETAFEDGEFTMEGLLDGILEKLKNIGTWIKTNIFEPFLKGFKEAFGINSPSTVMFDQGVFLIQGLLNGISSLIEKFEEKFDKLKKIIEEKFEKIKNVWDETWDKLASKVTNIFDKIKETVSSAVDKIKGWIGEIIDKYNNVKEKISSFSFSDIGSSIFSKLNISSVGNIKIPKLASGSVIPPNAPFMAVLGDQRHGTNIEAPLDTIKQAVKEVMGVGNSGGTYQFIAQIDGKTIFESVISEAQLRQSSTGRNKLVTL